MPKDKEVKAKKNANYMLMFRKIMFRAITIIIQTLLLGTCDIMIISHSVGSALQHTIVTFLVLLFLLGYRRFMVNCKILNIKFSAWYDIVNLINRVYELIQKVILMLHITDCIDIVLIQSIHHNMDFYSFIAILPYAFLNYLSFIM